jgi:ferredoxin
LTRRAGSLTITPYTEDHVYRYETLVTALIAQREQIVLIIQVDVDVCVGSGHCVLTAPAAFDQRDDDGTVLVIDPEVPQSERPKIEEAAQRCPASAITLREL